MKTSLSPPNAILFIFDMENENVSVPEYIDNVLTAANASCASVGTQADVDGEVLVQLQNQLSSTDTGICQQAFKGYIETPSNKIAVVTSECDKVLEKDVKGTKTEVCIWVDDLDFPSTVLVEAE